MKTFYAILAAMIFSYQAYSSELFIRVLKPGYFTASVANQTQTNSQNTFRFFDLAAGSISFQLIDQSNGSTSFYQQFMIAPNQRIVAEINAMNQVTIIQTIPISVINWYETTAQFNPQYGNQPNYNNGIPPNYNTPSNGGYNQPATDNSFPQFLAFLDRQTMDDNKLREATNYANKTFLSSLQIIEIAKKFTFDSNKLAWAKAAYSRCYDPANYFLFKDVFTFSSSYSELQTFIGH
jgi:hypothetical protein